MQDILLICEIVLFTCLFNLFAKDSKFTLNELNITKKNNSVIKSNNDVVVQKNSNDNTKNEAIAKKSNFKITSFFCFICNAIYFLLFCLNETYLI